ncbi:lanthionine synthetase C family protein [Bacillus thuringiensis]|uniref:lanthionine synthetase C family protein n=1 Tax=Bacillus thuringiensis TaxID=1428 RepID=UPI000D02AE9E|nr:lanthionine synthetase C family protein [Bacillus thuringiensis]MCU4819397.1 lanthionine synthetase C family protein [Bacillus cereus]PRT27434.1 lantibiotic biosynthesis protein [Bacillus thuringiensis]
MINKVDEREYISPLGDSEIKFEIERVILEITNRLKNPESVKGIVTNKNNTMKFLEKDIIPWEEVSLSTGYPSICLFLGELSENYPTEKWDVVAHNYVLQINEYLSKNGMYSYSLFQGFTGVGFAVTALSKGATRYQNFIRQTNDLVIDYINRILPTYYKKLEENNLGMSDYDVISGITGIGRYLLLYKENEREQVALKHILKFLVKMTENKLINNCLAPGWYISSENQYLDSEKELYPNGNFNLGLSHGIPGPLSLLSVSLKNGIEVEGQKEAIVKIADWLIKFKIESETGSFWSFRVDWDEFIAGEGKQNSASRAAWCYGTPGVARALYLAGKVTNNQEYIDVSIQTLDDLFNYQRHEWGLYSPTFCHGYAGLLHILNLMYIDTKKEKFKGYILELLQMILNTYDANSPFGFYNYQLGKDKMELSVNIGLIEGVSGILLVLLALIKPIKTDWDTAFLLN